MVAPRGKASVPTILLDIERAACANSRFRSGTGQQVPLDPGEYVLEGWSNMPMRTRHMGT